MNSFFARLRALNIRRCEQSFKHPLQGWNGMEWGCAAAGEMGELCNLLKKQQREVEGIAGSRIEGDQKQQIAEEIADVIIYLDLLAAQQGLDFLDGVISRKFNKTSAEVDFKDLLL